MAINYAPLHVHTDASLDGYGTVEALVKDAVKKGFTSLAMTDHGTLANAITFWTLCNKHGIKPILGMEGYIHYAGSNSDRNHLTLLAKTQQGFNNLIELSNYAHKEGWDGRRPVFGIDELERWKVGLHVLTGCHASPLHDSEYEQGMQFVGVLKDIMGARNLHAEVMFVSSFDDYKRALEAAQRFDIPYVVTNDTHFCTKGTHREQQMIYTARTNGADVGYNSIDCYLKTAHELVASGERWVNPDIVHIGLHNSLAIAEEVEEWNMHEEPSLPKVAGSLEYITRKLKIACMHDIKENGDKDIRIARLQREMKAFKERDLIDYVYILDNIIGYSRAQDILVGPGRGSGGGSYTLYLLGITRVDPIRYGLLFERFLSDARTDYPDVDVDFESERRSEVISYAADKWNAAPIATYFRYSHKSAVKDISKRLGISTVAATKAAEMEYGSEAWNAFCEEDKLRVADKMYNAMLGQIRHRSKHAGGIVITTKSVPMERIGKDVIAAAWTEGQSTRELSKAGIVKYDFLGLTALSQLQSMKKLTGVDFPETFDSKEVFDAFGEGRVTGIFQWSGSEGIRKMTMGLYKATGELTFKDLIAINALYRPGPLDAGTAMRYKDFKKSPRKLHPRIDAILEETYGVICYQEQVMSVYAEVSGAGLAEADKLRKAFAHGKEGDKGRAEIIEKFKATFMEGGEEQGFDSAFLEKVWREIATHSKYSFNKSHSTAYAMIAYRMAYYMVNHFAAFIKSMMIYDMTNAQVYLMEAVKRGTEIRAPEINISTDVVELRKEDGTEVLYLPLCDVGYLGEKGLGRFLDIRAELEKSKGLGNAFDTYEDFNASIPKMVMNKRVRHGLERITAFRNLLGNPEDGIADYGEIDWKGIQNTQIEILGYIIPTKEIYQKYEQLMELEVPKRFARNGERYAGIVVEAVQKLTRHGKNMVRFSLSPHDELRYFGNRPDLPEAGDLIAGVKTTKGIMRSFKVIRGIV